MRLTRKQLFATPCAEDEDFLASSLLTLAEPIKNGAT